MARAQTFDAQTSRKAFGYLDTYTNKLPFKLWHSHFSAQSTRVLRCAFARRIFFQLPQPRYKFFAAHSLRRIADVYTSYEYYQRRLSPLTLIDGETFDRCVINRGVRSSFPPGIAAGAPSEFRTLRRFIRHETTGGEEFACPAERT